MRKEPDMSIVLITGSSTGIGHVMAFSDLTREAFVRRLGFAETLELKR